MFTNGIALNKGWNYHYCAEVEKLVLFLNFLTDQGIPPENIKTTVVHTYYFVKGV